MNKELNDAITGKMTMPSFSPQLQTEEKALWVAVTRGIAQAMEGYTENLSLPNIQMQIAKVFRRYFELQKNDEPNDPSHQKEDDSCSNLLDAHRVAAAIGVSHWSIYRWANQGMIPS